jgi:hypothetical protein
MKAAFLQLMLPCESLPLHSGSERKIESIVTGLLNTPAKVISDATVVSAAG